MMDYRTINGHWLDAEAGPLVRPYTITGGRTRPLCDDLQPITLIAAPEPDLCPRHLPPEATALATLCRDQPLPVVELVDRLDLPASVVRVLLGDMIEQSLVVTQAPTDPGAPDVRLLQRVIEGVRWL